MNKQNLTIAALAAFLVLSMTAMAFAGPGQGRGANRGSCYQQNGPYSQLTPEKQQAVQAIFDKYDAKFDELRTQLWTKHSVLQALINGGNADEKKIAGLTSDITKLRDQMRDNRDAMRAEIEKETGLVGFGPGFAEGRGYGRHMGNGSGRMGGGYGMGSGPGYGMGNGPCVTN
jgi:zinc resistance-associated protein